MSLFKRIFQKLDTVICYNFFLFRQGLAKENLIETHLTIQEKKKLFELAKKTFNGVALEVGSFLGASACFISKGLGDSSQLICIDTWQNDAMSEGKRDTYKEFLKNTHQLRKKIIPLQGYSTDVLDQVQSKTSKLSLLFIDGDHSYEGCKTDWDLYCPLLRPGSVVVFHDYGWATGVQKVVHENVMGKVASSGSLPNMWWGIIK